ncbi:YfiT family bacillithiol transferase [Olivibacter sp. XZL3]|uniref:YfiT family bacillithiol transferase n=1 Tax=Olivibacter sp. XZL3 TaxID=1735116 RepID=UPI001F114E03|nr:bacillithiol transferase BstA [Olivibacter sp. XZL3]
MDLRYPIGQFEKPNLIGKQELSSWMETIALFPKEIAQEVTTLTDEQLDTPYRDGGWTVRQVVHHCADSHMNAFIRFKLALTETDPIIKPYHEALWAELPDSKIHLEPSLNLLKGLHERWSKLLESLDDEDLKRTYVHPEQGRPIPLDEVIGMYAWHCNHHLAHIIVLKKNNGWE